MQTLRALHGLSLAHLAEYAGISVSLVKHITKRRSNPALSVVLRLANALGVSVDQLVEDVIDPGAMRGVQARAVRYRDPDAIAAAIGPRAGSLRVRHGWTLREFSDHAGISKAMLHYLETNEVEVTTTMVARLAQAFGMSFSELVQAGESPILAMTRAPRGGRTVRPLLQEELTVLTEYRVDGAQRVARERAAPGSFAMLYVIEGSIRVSVGAEEHVLACGDAVMLSADQAYSISSATSDPARYVEVLCAYRCRVRTS